MCPFLHHQLATPICQRARAIGRLHQTMQRIFVVPGKIRPLEADRHLRSLFIGFFLSELRCGRRQSVTAIKPLPLSFLGSG